MDRDPACMIQTEFMDILIIAPSKRGPHAVLYRSANAGLWRLSLLSGATAGPHEARRASTSNMLAASGAGLSRGSPASSWRGHAWRRAGRWRSDEHAVRAEEGRHGGLRGGRRADQRRARGGHLGRRAVAAVGSVAGPAGTLPWRQLLQLLLARRLACWVLIGSRARGLGVGGTDGGPSRGRSGRVAGACSAQRLARALHAGAGMFKSLSLGRMAPSPCQAAWTSLVSPCGCLGPLLSHGPTLASALQATRLVDHMQQACIPASLPLSTCGTAWLCGGDRRAWSCSRRCAFSCTHASLAAAAASSACYAARVACLHCQLGHQRAGLLTTCTRSIGTGKDACLACPRAPCPASWTLRGAALCCRPLLWVPAGARGARGLTKRRCMTRPPTWSSVPGACAPAPA